MTVNLTRIYTRLGDGGETHLGDMSRVPKTHPRIESYGTVDELNAQLGVALNAEPLEPRFASWLRAAQNDRLERWCDEVNAGLPKLTSFVLPGGTPAAAQLHVCRTVCRRAERRTVEVGSELNPEVVRYLNRLSDLLFILSRAANGDAE